MKKKIIFAVLVTALTLGFNTASAFFDIDLGGAITTPPPGSPPAPPPVCSLAGLDAVQLNMTKPEVDVILGGTGSLVSRVGLLGTYYEVWRYGIDPFCIVEFDQGLVEDKDFDEFDEFDDDFDFDDDIL